MSLLILVGITPNCYTTLHQITCQSHINEKKEEEEEESEDHEYEDEL
jgi:hypothetical protein